jgi:hypothetical protein
MGFDDGCASDCASTDNAKPQQATNATHVCKQKTDFMQNVAIDYNIMFVFVQLIPLIVFAVAPGSEDILS